MKQWKRLTRRWLIFLLCGILTFLSCSLPVSAGSAGVRRDYSVTSITSGEVQLHKFTVQASFAYYGVSVKSSYTEGGDVKDCTSCDGMGYKTCSSCKGEGGTEKKTYVPCQLTYGYSDPYCQRSCDGYDYLCDPALGGCGHRQRSPHGKPQYCKHSGMGYWVPNWDCDCDTDQRDYIWKECKTCEGMGERMCTRCDGQGWYETPGHVVTDYPSNPLPQEVPVDFLVDGVVVTTAKFTPTITRESNTSDKWEKWGTLEAETEITAPVGLHTVEARINWDGRNSESDRTNNSKSISVEVLPVIDLQGDFVNPGAYYRAGTDVISTFRVHNVSNPDPMDVIPDDALRVDFKAVNPSTGAVIATRSTTGVVIPQGGTNIVYFKWHVPDNYTQGTVQLRCDINPDGAVDEFLVDNNTVTASNPVAKRSTSVTPDTTFEERAPSGWSKPSGSEAISTAGILTTASRQSALSYQIWEWDAANEAIVLKTYGVKLAPELVPEPDERAASRKLLSGGQWQMASGYGYTLQVKAVPKAGGAMPPSGAYTDTQSCSAYFPELRYSSVNNQYRTLEHTAASLFEFPLNANSINSSGAADPRRIHYIPLWYPDGNYLVRTLTYDCWTPAGMLVVEAPAPKLTIKGSMYDDHYVGH